MDDADEPTSNPLPPPPPRGGPGPRRGAEREKAGGAYSNLSNTDFRKMVMETPRGGSERKEKDQRPRKDSKGKRLEEDEEDGGERASERGGGGRGGGRRGRGGGGGGGRGKDAEAEKDKADVEENPSYRDRAEERRKDQNPDYVNTATELGALNAVGPPGTIDLLTGEAHRISIENSKFLGGDLEHTHLVKGLDFALLQKVRSELEHKQGEEGDERLPKERREEKAMIFRSTMAKAVYQHLVKPPVVKKVNEMFLKGRTLYVFDMDEEFGHEIPTTVVRSKDDCPPPEDTISVSVDSAVLERISRIMSYLRLGGSGKTLKKKKKEKENGKALLLPGVVPSIAEDGLTEEEEPSRSSAANGRASLSLPLPPPPPLPPPGPRDEEDDIFVGAGTDYKVELPNKRRGGEEGEGGKQEKMRMRGERGGKGKYFEQSSGLEELPPPPPPPPGEAMPALPPPPPFPQQWESGYPPAVQGPSFPPQQGGWEDYPPPPPAGEEFGGGGVWPSSEAQPSQLTDQTYPQYSGHYAAAYPQGYPDANSTWYDSNGGLVAPSEGADMGMDELPPPPPPGDPFPLGDPRASRDPKFMSQEEKDRGMGSVFLRDDNRLIGKKEQDMRERDPAFVSESYSECYPDYKGFTREVVESDDEEDLSKMDQGSKAKGRLHQWDFETEEEWTRYNESKEAMPKAAFQFGVKTADGRRTRKSGKDREQKLNNELHQITKIMERRKKDGDDDYGEETPNKKTRY